ncbi:hypothetical protein BsWGS_17492 [Bradybaena similaris]
MPGTDLMSQIADVDIKWKLSVAVSCTDVRSLSEPLVTMMMVTTDEDGEKVHRSVEMTVLKFRELLGTLKQIQAQMDHAKLV